MQFNLPLIINEIPPAFNDPFWSLKYKKEQYVNIYRDLYHKIYIRTRLAEAQNWKCCWCGCETTALRGKNKSATTEHVTPRSLGGSDGWENLAMACYGCNTRRGATDADEFFKNGKRKDNAPRAETRKETQAKANHRRHLKRGQIFADNNWITSDGKQYSFEEWILTLRGVSKEFKEELYEKFGKKENN